MPTEKIFKVQVSKVFMEDKGGKGRRRFITVEKIDYSRNIDCWDSFTFQSDDFELDQILQLSIDKMQEPMEIL